MKKIGVILSGCGFMDGAEIHESVLTLLALDRAGAEVICMAPNVQQSEVVDHVSGKKLQETRNVLVESARIARGSIKDVAEVTANDLDGIMLPGGYGAAKSLSTFAVDGAKASVHPAVRQLLEAMYAQKKPIGALCIAPVVLAAALGKHQVKLTIGSDAATARAIEVMGSHHEKCPVESIVVDFDHKIVSSPAYMLGPNIRHVAAGIELCVAELMRMA